MNYIDLVIGVLMLSVGLLATVFAREFRAGIAGPVYRPTAFKRFIAAVVLFCVGSTFIYVGIGSPPRYATLADVLFAVLDVFLCGIAIAAVTASVRLLSSSVPSSRQQKARASAFVVLGVMAAVVAGADFLTRIRRVG